MSDRSDHLDDESNFARSFLETVLTTAIESGDILVGDRQVDDILADFREWARNLAASDGDIPLTIEHRPGLLTQAEQHAAAANYTIALILYATWIEHSINDLVTRGLERQNVSQRSTRALLRAVSLDPKITALWEVAGIPAMDTELVKSILRIASVRNEFVHYKWPCEPEDPRRAESSSDRYEAATKLCEEVVSAIADLAESYLWHGRRTEILSAFRLRWH